MLLFLTLLLLTVTLLLTFLKRTYTFWERQGVKQLASTNIIFGSLYENLIKKKSLQEIIKEHYDAFKTERYYGMYQLHLPVLVLRDAELIKTITVKDFESFSDHGNHARDDVDLFWSRNVFALQGDKWHQMRATLSPAFTSSKMRMMFPLIIDCAERFTKFFDEKDGDILNLEMKDTFTRATNDVIASCAFGLQCDSLRDRDNKFYKTGRDGFDFTGFIRKTIFFTYCACPSLLKLFGLKIFTNEMASFFQTVINDTIALREETGIVRPDMIHLLLQARKGNLLDTEESVADESFAQTQEYSLNGNNNNKYENIGISNYDIAAQAAVFFLGGFDTTSYMMSFTAYELAIHPDIQARLLEEIDGIAKGCNGKLRYEDMQKMKYLDMILSESLRKWPILAINDRICTKDYVIEPVNETERRVVVKKGMIIWLPVFGIHRDGDIYENPEKFDPERFSPENRRKINQATYIGFGSGPRNCIGARFALLETKVFLFHLLRRFEFVPTEATPIPIVISKDHFNTFVDGGLPIGFKKRRN